MQYISTRNKKTAVSAPDAIISGIAPDGGLYIPEAPVFDSFDWEALLSMDFQSQAERIFSFYFGELPELGALVLKAYGPRFDTPEITPLVKTGDRYVLELNQILDRETPRIVRRSPADLFDCDLFLFTASRGVPPVGAAGDVRMLQFEKNREMLRAYAKQARSSGFRGLFCQISDPVDLLARAVFLQSNRNEGGALDFGGLLPEQIVGFGLGVMKARADFMARRMGKSCPNLRAYGPHGAGLVIANDPAAYDEALSLELTRQTVAANVEVRALGFKPYIAPAVSSACLSILQLIRGEAFHGAVPLGGVYFGCRSRRMGGFASCTEALHPALVARIEVAWQALREEEPKCLA